MGSNESMMLQGLLPECAVFKVFLMPSTANWSQVAKFPFFFSSARFLGGLHPLSEAFHIKANMVHPLHTQNAEGVLLLHALVSELIFTSFCAEVRDVIHEVSAEQWSL
jgi:hypothetical protein